MWYKLICNPPVWRWCHGSRLGTSRLGRHVSSVVIHWSRVIWIALSQVLAEWRHLLRTSSVWSTHKSAGLTSSSRWWLKQWELTVRRGRLSWKNSMCVSGHWLKNGDQLFEFLMHRLSVAIRRGNAARILGTLPFTLQLDDIYYLCKHVTTIVWNSQLQ